LRSRGWRNWQDSRPSHRVRHREIRDGAVLSRCQLLIANDSGPLHIGTGVGTNVIGIFGPTAPRETAPMGLGRNMIVQYAPEGVTLPWIGKNFPHGDWMEHISVESVFDLIVREKLIESHGFVKF